MNIYIYQADCYCEQCGETLRKRLNATGHVPTHPEDERTYDSDYYPKGPYCDGGGESDCPEHCGSGEDCLNALVLSDGTKVGCWLENPITSAGVRYIQEYLRDAPESEVTKLWAEWYKEELESNWGKS